MNVYCYLVFAYVFDAPDTVEYLLFHFFLSHSVGKGKVNHVTSYSCCSGGLCVVFETEKME